jgi:PAS domain S-box-containing protein
MKTGPSNIVTGLIVPIVATQVVLALAWAAGVPWNPVAHAIGTVVLTLPLWHVQRRVRSMRDEMARSHSMADALDAARQEVAASEQRLKEIIEGAGCFAWEFCVEEDRFTSVSFEERRLGFSRARWMEPGFWDSALHEDDRERTGKECLGEIAAGRAHRLNYRMVGTDGRVYHISDYVSEPYKRDGKTLVRGVALDVTDRVVAEQRVIENELRTRLVIDTALDAVVAMDDKGFVTQWNAQAERTFGWSAEEAIGKPMHELIIPESMRGRHVCGLERYKKTGHGPVLNTRIEVPALRRDGTEIMVELAITPVRTDGSIWFSAFLRDITERKRAEAALRESERRVRAIFDGEPECVKLMGANGELFEINPAGLAMLEAESVEQVRELGTGTFLAPEHRTAFAAMLKKVMQGGSADLEYEVIGLKGTRRWMETRAVPLRGEKGDISAALVVTRDVTESRALAQGLQRQAALLMQIEQVAGIGAWDLDFASGVVTWSPQTRAIHEVDESFVPTLENAIRFYAPDARAAMAAAVERGKQTGEAWDLELPFITGKGNRRWVRAVGHIERRDGMPVRAFGTFQDITEQRARAEELARASADARRLAAAIDAHADAVFLTDANGVITRVNHAFTQLSRYEAAEAIGMQKSILRSERTPRETYEDLWRTIEQGKPWQGRLCNKRPERVREEGACVSLPVLGQVGHDEGEDSLYYWVDATITPMVRADGTIEGHVAVERDVTAVVEAEDRERHRVEGAEARLRVAKALAGTGTLKDRLDAAVDSVLEMRGLDVQRKGGVFLLAPGESHLRLYTIRGDFGESFERDESSVAIGHYLCGRAAASGEVIVSDNCFTDHRHEHRWPGMTAHGHYIVPLVDRSATEKGSACVGVMFLYTEPNPAATQERVAALHEIGELVTTAILQHRAAEFAEAARLKAESASRAKSEFLANMSHEIRTPLTAILGYAEMFREEGGQSMTPTQRGQTLDTIRNAGEHLLAVINDILDLSKIEADRMTIERVETPLIQIVHEVESLIRPRASEKGVSLSVELGTVVPERIVSDPTRLRQILTNLAGNAVKFTDAGGIRIRLSVSRLTSRLVIDVMDTGKGMTQEQAGRLFTAFMQADQSVTRRHGGTGLGLSICRRLAGLMGGTVELRRTRVGGGSWFRCVFPMEAVPETRWVDRMDVIGQAGPLVESAAALGRLTGKILLAEDGTDNQRLIGFFLRKAGAIVEIAENGSVALLAVEKAASSGEPFDLLLTDMQMPVMDGYRLATLLRARGSEIPIVALTAHAMAEDRDRCLEAGCDDYATKPIDRARLIEVCARWMGKKGGGRKSSAA